MTAPNRPYFLLGRTLAAFRDAGIDHEDRVNAGWRIRIDRLQETKHREIEWEDLCDTSSSI